MKTGLLLILFTPLLITAQTDTAYHGIKWENHLTWQQIKLKAKDENKYIFFDCYATWCAPCKWMENNTFLKQNVGDFFNSKFICVKIQMDSTKEDGEEVRTWRNIGNAMRKKYKITSFPTFLFFSPEGEIIHKNIGLMHEEYFISTAKNALNPDKEYYRMLKMYEEGKRDTSAMKQLAMLSESFGENQVAMKIANDCLSVMGQKALTCGGCLEFMEHFASTENAQKIARNYINGLKVAQLYNRQNIEFMAAFMQNSNNRTFDLLYSHAAEVDSVMGSKGYADEMVRSIIEKEDVFPNCRKATKNGFNAEIDWERILRIISRKYSLPIAQRCVLEGKVSIYQYRTQKFDKNWQDYIKYNLELMEKYGVDTTNGMVDMLMINNFAYNTILFHCDDQNEIWIMIKWMEGVVRRNPESAEVIDTYANLLYKANRNNEALKWEEKALKSAVDQKKEKIAGDYQVVIAKMKTGQPTWL